MGALQQDTAAISAQRCISLYLERLGRVPEASSQRLKVRVPRWPVMYEGCHVFSGRVNAHHQVSAKAAPEIRPPRDTCCYECAELTIPARSIWP